jgi:hypothetical protein
MKNKSIAALLALALSALCQAGERVPSVFIAVGYSPHQPAARMKVPADYVAVPLNIQNDSRDPVKRADEIEKTLRALAEKLAPHPDLKIMPGVVSLSPRELSKLSSDSQAGSAQLYVLGSLKGDATVFAMTKRIYQIVSAMPLADGTRITFGSTSLGLEEPEKYRSEILGLIAKSVAEARKSLGSASLADIEGLENAVSVMQLNDWEVLLFINYRMRVQNRAM